MKRRACIGCPMCDGTMELKRVSQVFEMGDKEIEIRGIEAYECDTCGETIYSSQEAKMIEKLMHAIEAKPKEKRVYNLSETAEYLRVSNQTVYNMIRDGRIRAYKAGREWRFLQSDIVAYLDSTANNKGLALAAKGGEIDKDDYSIITQELEKWKQRE